MRTECVIVVQEVEGGVGAKRVVEEGGVSARGVEWACLALGEEGVEEGG